MNERDCYETGWAVCSDCGTRRPASALHLGKVCADRDWCERMKAARVVADAKAAEASKP